MKKGVLLFLALLLLACGSGTPAWWYEYAKEYRDQWVAGGKRTGAKIFTGDSIPATCGPGGGPERMGNDKNYYPEFWTDPDHVLRAIGGLPTGMLYEALDVMIAEELPRELYILSGHHDIDTCGGYVHMPIEYRTKKSMEHFGRVIEKVRENNPTVQIFLMNLPPLTAGNDQSEVLSFNAGLRAFAESYGPGVYYEDRWDDFVGADGHMRPELTWDAHHPNRAGCQVYFDKYR